MGAPAEEDLVAWGHHRDVSTVPDAVMQRMDPGIVSFVFSCKARPWRAKLHKGCNPRSRMEGLPCPALRRLQHPPQGRRLQDDAGAAVSHRSHKRLPCTRPLPERHRMTNVPLQVDGKPVEEEPLQARNRPAGPTVPVAVPRQSRSARSAPGASAAQVRAKTSEHAYKLAAE